MGNDQEKAYLPAYEKVTLARRIYHFYSTDPNRTNPPGSDMDAAVKKIRAILDADDPEKESELFHEMFNIMAAVSLDSPVYQRMMPVLRDMEAFKRDEYSLYAPLPEDVLQAERQKKCRYMDETTGGRGITFATGTPISNSMVELYTMMRYLQFDTLERNGHRHFDSWAADFGEKVTAMELKPEGTGFRSKTRFAKFYNLPELISIWKEAADIQTADMLKLPTPEAVPITVTTEPSKFQQEMVAELADRADAVRNRLVDPSVDNMLRITSDGRKLALDQRLQNPLLPDDPDSKVNACVKNVLTEWQNSMDIRGTQLVFCDRNRFLVEHAAVLLAVYNGVKRSGTGATVNYARKMDREIIVIDPITRCITHGEFAPLPARS